MSYLYINSYSNLSQDERLVEVDDDIYKRYRNYKIAYQSTTSDKYVSILIEGKRYNLARLILDVHDRRLRVKTINNKRNVLTRKNLFIVDQSYINRNRRPTCYGKTLKGTYYTNNTWYARVYFTHNKYILRKCTCEIEAAHHYDAMSNYLNIPGFRNFEKVSTDILTSNDREKLDKILSSLNKKQ